MTRQQAEERAYEIMVTTMPAGSIENPATGKARPKAVRMRDAIADAIMMAQAGPPPAGEALRIADRLAARLFTNGVGDVAERLVLTTKDRRDMGGWCRGAVRDQIIDALTGGKAKSRK